MGDSEAVSRLKNQQRMGGAGVLIAFSHDPLPATINHERWRGRRDQAPGGKAEACTCKRGSWDCHPGSPGSALPIVPGDRQCV